nr:MAG TPA: hypothetical protein [Inoviridae sp.]
MNRLRSIKGVAMIDFWFLYGFGAVCLASLIFF